MQNRYQSLIYGCPRDFSTEDAPSDFAGFTPEQIKAGLTIPAALPMNMGSGDQFNLHPRRGIWPAA